VLLEFSNPVTAPFVASDDLSSSTSPLSLDKDQGLSDVTKVSREKASRPCRETREMLRDLRRTVRAVLCNCPHHPSTNSISARIRLLRCPVVFFCLSRTPEHLRLQAAEPYCALHFIAGR
jgi:hypothetical protein